MTEEFPVSQPWMLPCNSANVPFYQQFLLYCIFHSVIYNLETKYTFTKTPCMSWSWCWRWRWFWCWHWHWSLWCSWRWWAFSWSRRSGEIRFSTAFFFLFAHQFHCLIVHQNQLGKKGNNKTQNGHLGCSASFNYMEFKKYESIHKDGAVNSQGGEHLHSVKSLIQILCEL